MSMIAAPIRMHSGRVLDILHPRPEDILLSDVAYHLGHITRWTGAGPFTDAQHCVLVSRLCPWSARAWGLIHDGPEVIVGDVAHNLKRLLGESYRRLERPWINAFAERFDVTPCDVRKADDEAARLEAEYMWPGVDPRDIVPGMRPAQRWTPITPLSSRDASEQWLARARQLGID